MSLIKELFLPEDILCFPDQLAILILSECHLVILYLLLGLMQLIIPIRDGLINVNMLTIPLHASGNRLPLLLINIQ